jgi:large subunit ribosomal protein L30
VSTLRLKLIKSPIGYKEDQKDTVKALGLKRLGQVVEREDTPTVRGMVHKVAHLVQIEDEA